MKERKELNKKSVSRPLYILYDEKEINIPIKSNVEALKNETFNKVALQNFVAQSYAESCLTLLQRVDNYVISDSNLKKHSCALRYFPAMFCFRHYLELKLKYLYMRLTDKEFDTNSHKLSELLNEVKHEGFKYNVFDEPVKYVEDIEEGPDYFRYIMNKALDCSANNLKISVFQFDKIREYITEIEFRVEMYLTCDFLKKRKK